VLKTIGSGLASLTLFSTTGAPAQQSTGTGDEADRPPEATIATALGFGATTITTAETTTITCEWEVSTDIASGGFHTLKTVVQSATIDSPETVAEPFQPDTGWSYDTTGEAVPIRGAMYRWSVRDRWVRPGTYRVRARVDPFYPGEITALAGPYGGDYFDWAKATLSVEW